MRRFPSEDQDYELWWLILHVRRAMRKLRAKELFQYGITPEEAAVLFVVQAIGDKATPAEIARYLLREPHTISGLLSRMVGDGLVRKTKDLARKNRVRVLLTDKGRKAYKQSTKRESVHRVMSCLSEEERQQLRAPLGKLCQKALEELGTDRQLPFLCPT
ncbi:MAG: MarR family winged helix-turn-helix transcriptional regulator [Dehalococcoidales bacterium]